MSEFSLVEKPILSWIKDELGWSYRTEKELEIYDRPITNPIIKKLLIESLLIINEDINAKEAEEAVNILQRSLANSNKLLANKNTIDLLRHGATINPLSTDSSDSKTINYFEFKINQQDKNSFIVTNQYRVQGVKQCRDDLVLLINGVPLIIGEFKSFITSRKDWTEGVRQLHRYQRQAPIMMATNLFCISADEEEFRYGTVLFDNLNKQNIDEHIDTWGQWLSQYPEIKCWWNTKEAEKVDDKLEMSVKGLIRLKPCHVLDFLQNFIVFETKFSETTKKIARYQQFEASNDIVDRVLNCFGEKVDSSFRTGLIWHTQGSGKSLTMIFTAYKLRIQKKLKNPLVLVVVDRIDLKTDLSDEFIFCEYPNVKKAMGISDLKEILENDWRGTAITTIQSFQKMDATKSINHDSVISLIDECHRSQSSKTGTSFAMTMRSKLPNSFRFGFTGTPIDKTMINTHRDFGPQEDSVQERYLSYYGNKRSLKDKTTVPIHYIRDKVPFVFDDTSASAKFEKMCEELELEDEESKDFVQRKKSKWREIAKHPDRIAIVSKKIVKHFLDYPNPSGFKAQLVAIDREACVLYKEVLDELFLAYEIEDSITEVIISASQNDDEMLEKFHYDTKKQRDIINNFKLTADQLANYNKELFNDEEEKFIKPVKILIVCDRLLTGFDAPVEQVMYLDKPLRDHSLLQAIARTNRPFLKLKKEVGVIVDYFGVFENLERALNFSEDIIEESLIDWDSIKDSFNQEINNCLALFLNIQINDTRNSYLESLRVLSNNKNAKIFLERFKSVERMWEAISPDPYLMDFKENYKWLCGVYVAYRRRQSGTKNTFNELANKTKTIIYENTSFVETIEKLPIITLDENFSPIDDYNLSATDKAAALESMLTNELSEGNNDFIYRKLGERLMKLKEKHDDKDISESKRLLELESIYEDLKNIEKSKKDFELDDNSLRVFNIFNNYSTNTDLNYISNSSKRLIEYLKNNNLLFNGWSNNVSTRNETADSIVAELLNDNYVDLGFDTNNPNPEYINIIIEELSIMDN